MQSRKIFVSTLFKSGSKLLEKIIHQTTGKSPHIVPMFKGVTPDYRSQNPITFNKGEFFLWHNIISEEVCLRIKQENAKPIFLSRNIYDLVVSQYHHFRLDVDAEIDHSTSTTKFLSNLTKRMAYPSS